MTRLNNSIKEAVIENAIEKSGIKDREVKLRERRAELAENARVFALGGKEKVAQIEKIMKKVEALINDIPPSVVHDQHFRRDYDILINAAGMREYFSFDPNGSTDVYKVTPSTALISADNQLADEFNAIHDEEQEVRDKRHNIVSTINAVFKKVGTVKRLIEVWPEAEELLPSDLSAAKNTLPAIRTEDLNAMIGLPTEK